MKLRPLVLFTLAAALAGCGSHGAQTTTQTAPAPQMGLTVFDVVGGALRARMVRVERTEAVAGAALKALGFDTTVSIDAGTAVVGLDSVTPAEAAEIVYTLTEFPSVRRVDVDGRHGLTRADVSSFVPPILVEQPAAAAEVASVIAVRGTASVFEATLVVELRQGGRVIVKKTVTASEGAPARGTFSTTLAGASAGPATIAAYAPSAEDGTPQHEQDIPVLIKP